MKVRDPIEVNGWARVACVAGRPSTDLGRFDEIDSSRLTAVGRVSLPNGGELQNPTLTVVRHSSQLYAWNRSMVVRSVRCRSRLIPTNLDCLASSAITLQDHSTVAENM